MSSLGNTVAWSHRGGYWKTRYSFASYCYAFLDRIFFSFGVTFSNQPIWRHDSDVVPYTSFYGTVDGSAIALSFKENVSSNKIYKSFSLESTNNVNGLSILTVNNSTVADQTQNLTATVLEERGGIMYGDVGIDQRLTGANVKMVGRVRGATPLGEALVLDIDFVDGGQSYNISANNNTKFFFGNQAIGADVDTTVTYFQVNIGATIDLPATHAALPNTLSAGTLLVDDIPVDLVGTNTVVLASVNNFELPETGDTYLYSVSPGEENGEAARGQSVDAVITLGSNPYELYAVNLEYEETNYDHRDERFARRGLTGRQRTTQGQQRQRRRR